MRRALAGALTLCILAAPAAAQDLQANPTQEELVRSLSELGRVQTQGAGDCIARRGELVLLVLRRCPLNDTTLVTLHSRRLPNEPPAECVIKPGEKVTEDRVKACGADLVLPEEPVK